MACCRTAPFWRGGGGGGDSKSTSAECGRWTATRSELDGGAGDDRRRDGGGDDVVRELGDGLSLVASPPAMPVVVVGRSDVVFVWRWSEQTTTTTFNLPAVSMLFHYVHSQLVSDANRLPSRLSCHGPARSHVFSCRWFANLEQVGNFYVSITKDFGLLKAHLFAIAYKQSCLLTYLQICSFIQSLITLCTCAAHDLIIITIQRRIVIAVNSFGIENVLIFLSFIWFS